MLTARGRVRIALDGQATPADAEVHFAGHPFDQRVLVLGPGTTQVMLLDAQLGAVDRRFAAPPSWVRHIVLGGARPSNTASRYMRRLIACEACPVAGATDVRTTDLGPEAQILVSGRGVSSAEHQGLLPTALEARLPLEPTPFRAASFGGPLLGLGIVTQRPAAATPDEGNMGFAFVLGYDVLVLAEYLNLQVQLMTDFATFVGEALVLELSSPVALAQQLSLTAAIGAGVALRQLDGREDEAALRVQAAIRPLPVFGFTFGLDYWPASEGVDAMFALLLGI